MTIDTMQRKFAVVLQLLFLAQHIENRGIGAVCIYTFGVCSRVRVVYFFCLGILARVARSPSRDSLEERKGSTQCFLPFPFFTCVPLCFLAL